MTNVVDYIISLKGNLAGGLSAATSQATALETQLGGVKSMATSIGSALGIGFAVFQGVSFVKEGVEKFKELEEVTAKIGANLTATGEKAGVSLKNVEEYAKGLSGKIQASRVDIMDMASQMLTFPAISKDVFQSSMGLVADIAKQTGHGLSETAIMYGKALNDPTDGLQKMMRYGVMFTDQEKLKIKTLQESGNLIGAQKYMMDAIAHSGYAGVAEAMFNADPVARFNKMMGSAKLAIGEVAVDILKKLMPVLETVAKWFRDSIVWMKEHEKTVALVATVIGTLAVVFGTITIATQLWAGAVWLLNAAMAVSPITWVIAGIAALVAGVMWAWNTFEGFRKAVFIVWEVLKAFGIGVGKVFFGLGEVIAGALTLNPSLIKKGLSDTVNGVKDAIKDISEAGEKGSKAGAASWLKSGKDAKGLVPGKGAGGASTVSGGGSVAAPKTKAEGQKTINIHVVYNAPLIKEFTISTTNIQEGLGSLKDKVSAILTGATHDALMVTDY